LKRQQEEAAKRQVELKRQAEERKHPEELIPQKETQSPVGASPAGDSPPEEESPAGLAPTAEVESPPLAINAISEPLPTKPKRFAWKTVAIAGVVLTLGIGGFVWKQNSGNRRVLILNNVKIQAKLSVFKRHKEIRWPKSSPEMAMK
jgi:hypothetical protein